MLRVLLVDEFHEHGDTIGESLKRAGHRMVATIAVPSDLVNVIEQTNPDIIVVNTASPSRDALEALGLVSRDQPRAIVMFARDDDASTICAATNAGVSAYVVGSFDGARVKAIVEVACARFVQIQRLRANLAMAQSRLAERESAAPTTPNNRMVLIRA